MNKVLSVLLLSFALGNVVVADKSAEQGHFKRNQNKYIAATISALVLGGAAGTVYLYRDSEFLAPKIASAKNCLTSAKDAVVAAPGQAWTFTKEHYIAVPLVTGGVLVGTAAAIDLLRGDKSLLKRLVKGVSEKVEEKKSAAIVSAK